MRFERQKDIERENKAMRAIAIYKAFFVDELIDLSQYHKEGTL